MITENKKSISNSFENDQRLIHQILQSEFLRAKMDNPSYSLRSLARRLSIPPSGLSDIFCGKRKITHKMALKIFSHLKVSVEQKKILESVVHKLNKSEKIGVKKQKSEKKFTPISMDTFHLFSDWYYFAILSLMETKKFSSNPDWISERLGISKDLVIQALDRLEKLEMILKNEKGKLVITGKQYSTSDGLTNMLIRYGHHQTLNLASEALDAVPLELRDFSSMTMAIDVSLLPKATTLIRQFRRKLCALLESGEQEEVYRLAIQLFPLTKSKETK